MIDLEILANVPKDWTHVSTSMIDAPPTWLRYEVDGVYSVWMDDNGTNPNPFWREMPNNCIEFPEFIRSRNDIEQLAKANERLKESEQVRTEYSFLIADLVRRADVKNDLYKNPTYQKASEQLNKFAIEQQVRALDKFYCLVVTSGEPVTTQSVRNYIEQLRKEQEK